MPATVVPSVLTISAPTLCCASSARSARTPASGEIVTTSRLDLAWSTSPILIHRRYSCGRVQVQGRSSGVSVAPVHPQLGDRAGAGAARVGIVVVVGQRAQERQRGLVQVPVGGERVAAERSVGAVERGE